MDKVGGKFNFNVTKMRQQAKSDNLVSITNPILHFQFGDQEKKSTDYKLDKIESAKAMNEETEELPCWKETFTFDVVGIDKLSEAFIIKVYDSETYIGELKSKA